MVSNAVNDEDCRPNPSTQFSSDPPIIDGSIPSTGTFHLAAWKVSGDTQLQQIYQKQLQNYTPKHGDLVPELLTKAPENDGLPGVILGKLILFRHLWKI